MALDEAFEKMYAPESSGQRPAMPKPPAPIAPPESASGDDSEAAFNADDLAGDIEAAVNGLADLHAESAGESEPLDDDGSDMFAADSGETLDDDDDSDMSPPVSDADSAAPEDDEFQGAETDPAEWAASGDEIPPPPDSIPVAMPVDDDIEEPVFDTYEAQTPPSFEPADEELEPAAVVDEPVSVAMAAEVRPPRPVRTAPGKVVHNGQEVELLPFNPASIRQVDAFRMNRQHDAELFSTVAEEFRVLRANLASLQERRGIQSVTFSSCHHGEGKTTTITNLARFMAKGRDRRILLVDTDIRRPRVKELLGLKVEYGIDDVLAGKCSLEQAMVFSEADNLTVLPARRGHSNATEMLELPLMDSLIATMAEHFDFVLYDSTPIFSTADPSVMGAKTDGLMMVVKAGMTYRESIEHAQHQIEQAGGVILGLILNQLRVYLPRYLSRYHYYQDYYTDYYHRRRAS